MDKAQLTMDSAVHNAAHVDKTNGNVPLGSVMHDTGKITDGLVTGLSPAPITFTFYANGTCDGAGTSVSNTGADEVATTRDRSAASAALAAGSYSYKAFVATNGNYLGSDSGCEPFTVDKAQLTMDSAVHNAAHVDKTNGNVPLGSVMHDTGKITDGLVTGLSPAPITFTFYANGTCDGAGTSVSNTGADEVATTRDRSAASAALAAGSYSYKAFVATNGNYLGSDSGCEPFTVDKAQLTMDSAVHNAAHVDKTNGNVPLGSVMHDTGKITDGLVTGLSPAPITFTFYANGTCDGAGTSVSNTGADEVATTRDRSAATTMLATGSYSYKAFVATNGNYLGSDSGCEPFTVDKAQLTMDSAVHNAAHVDKTNGNVPLGSVMHDTGKITGGLVNGYAPEAITFQFYANGNCSYGSAIANTGADEGDATRDRSAASAALGAGSYSYKAFVAGNANYKGSDSGCEPFTVDKAQLTMDSKVHDPNHFDVTNTTVAAGTALHDTGKITGGVVTGFSTAPITFTFYANGNCSGAGSSVANTGADQGDATRDRSAASAALGPGSYSYKAFVATNGNYLGSDSGCEPFSVIQKSLVTDSSLCTFDVDSSVAGNQFRLLYTPDASGWKLNASNPGQYYYNAFDNAPTGTIKFTIPYPFVTQGNTPIHLYSSVTTQTVNGQTCLIPGTEIGHSDQQITLASYTNPTLGTTTTTVTVNFSSPITGFVYANIHLDYGLKGTTGYAKGGIQRAGCNSSANDAVAFGNQSNILIPDCASYPFSFQNGTSDSQTVSSRNVFKKDPGIAGLVLQNGTGNPVPNVPVNIQGDGQNVTVYTDDDGWYMWQYTYHGKATTFKVKALGITQNVTVKSNAFVIVNFTAP